MQPRKTSFWKTVLVILTVLCCTVTLVSQRARLRQKEAELTDLTNQAAQLTQEISGLEDRISGFGSPEVIREIAREQLGFADSGEIVFIDTNH